MERARQLTHSVAHHLLILSNLVNLVQVSPSHGRFVWIAALYLFKLVYWKGVSQKSNPVAILDLLRDF